MLHPPYRLLTINPSLVAIVSSGYSDDSTLAAHKQHGFKSCLSKPYGLKELSATLNQLL